MAELTDIEKVNIFYSRLRQKSIENKTAKSELLKNYDLNRQEIKTAVGCLSSYENRGKLPPDYVMDYFSVWFNEFEMKYFTEVKESQILKQKVNAKKSKINNNERKREIPKFVSLKNGEKLEVIDTGNYYNYILIVMYQGKRCVFDPIKKEIV